MDVSPLPFLRLGFAILALSVAFAVWTGHGSWPDPARLTVGLATLVAVAGLGELIVRRVAATAKRTTTPFRNEQTWR
ncbi:MAG: hypothetical protein R3D67_15775 [Hyphomicrobiaceae bacterium]